MGERIAKVPNCMEANGNVNRQAQSEHIKVKMIKRRILKRILLKSPALCMIFEENMHPSIAKKDSISDKENMLYGLQMHKKETE